MTPRHGVACQGGTERLFANSNLCVENSTDVTWARQGRTQNKRVSSRNAVRGTCILTEWRARGTDKRGSRIPMSNESEIFVIFIRVCEISSRFPLFSYGGRKTLRARRPRLTFNSAVTFAACERRVLPADHVVAAAAYQRQISRQTRRRRRRRRLAHARASDCARDYRPVHVFCGDNGPIYLIALPPAQPSHVMQPPLPESLSSGLFGMSGVNSIRMFGRVVI